MCIFVLLLIKHTRIMKIKIILPELTISEFAILWIRGILVAVLVAVLSLTLTSCGNGDSTNSTKTIYTYELEVIYNNGDTEILTVNKYKHRYSNFKLSDDGCIRTKFKESVYNYDNIACYVRKFRVINFTSTN